METQNKHLDDIIAIRRMMEKSSKFLSLSGLSGIFAGICALIGAFVAYFFILDNGSIKYNEYLNSLSETSTNSLRLKLFFDAILVLFFALGGALYFSIRKAKKNNQKIWNKTSKQLILQLFIPLLTGGIFSLILIWHHNIQLVASTTLIFYGLALVNAGKYTLNEIHYLGICEIILGLLSGVFLNYGILFWSLGFGVLHIVYGYVMYMKYER